MTDFMQWLYANYIKPQLDRAPQGDYELWLSLMDLDLFPYQRPAYKKAFEFYIIHAFLLGLRTGAGLERFR